jgi:integrase
MKTRFRLIRRNIRGGKFYSVDTLTGKRTSLGTQDEDTATQLVQAKNQAERQPALNLHIAKAYLAGSESGIATRTWQDALRAIIDTKVGETKTRWERAAKEKALNLIRNRVIVETQAELLLSVLKAGTVSTNVHLRKVHNFCLDMNWLPWPILPKKQWPKVTYKEKRAITIEEHQKIIAREGNPERKAFYELCWHVGGAQGDVAGLQASDIDWDTRTISYRRKKTDVPAILHFGEEVARVLLSRPKLGVLFPYLASLRASDRATEFKQRCRTVEVNGVTLHSYRYAWAERAKSCGYPERFAQQALGHNSKAIHRTYARKAHVELPPLEDFERTYLERKIVSLPASNNSAQHGIARASEYRNHLQSKGLAQTTETIPDP